MFNEKTHNLKMDKAIEVFSKELSSLRTGRANIAMLDLIKVDVYGQLMPIEQLATVSVPEARLISIQVLDKSNTALIEAAIQKSDLLIINSTSKKAIFSLDQAFVKLSKKKIIIKNIFFFKIKM